MERNPARKARVKSSGAFIEVYQHRPTGDWVNAIDCTTTYKTEELDFI